MALHQFYFVPLTSLTYGAALVTNQDVVYSASVGQTLALNADATTDILKVQDTADATFNDDTQFDQQTLAEAYGPYDVGAGVELNYMLTLSGSDGSTVRVISIAMNNDTGVGGATTDQISGFASDTKLQPGVTYTVTAYDSLVDVAYSDLVPCFTRGTMIRTPGGDRKIEDLKAGDLVMTQDNGAQPIRWIGQRSLSRRELGLKANLRPIRVRAGALGGGLPARDMMVSPQHRILVRSNIAARMFDSPEVLVAAKQLLGVPGIEICDDLEGVTYLHMLFDRHEVVWSDGALTESLYTGPMALKAVGPAARAEIEELFPELCAPDHVPLRARPFAVGKKARHMAERHVKNDRALVV